MNDFVTNLARRALGNGPRADVSPSRSAALANQLALPIAAAPAPSPKRTQVLRSVQFVIELSFSAPITSTVS